MVQFLFSITFFFKKNCNDRFPSSGNVDEFIGVKKSDHCGSAAIVVASCFRRESFSMLLKEIGSDGENQFFSPDSLSMSFRHLWALRDCNWLVKT